MMANGFMFTHIMYDDSCHLRTVVEYDRQPHTRGVLYMGNTGRYQCCYFFCLEVQGYSNLKASLRIQR